MKRNMQPWDKKMERYKAGQKLLNTQRFQFPPEWLWIDIIENEWSAFKQIL
jgi:dynein heavy chain 1